MVLFGSLSKMAHWKTLLLLLPITIMISQNNGNTRECPSFKNIADFQNSSEIRRIQEQIMDDLWDIETPDLTDLGDDLADILFDMAESRVSFWRTYALATTEWIWAYLPDIEKNLNLCSYAEMINQTLIFTKKNDCKSILEAINSSSKAFTEAGFRLTENGIRNAGCNNRSISLSIAANTKCYKNGFAYNIREMWDTIGWEYPWNLRETVLNLYKSSDKKDKVMALMATAVLSKYLAILESEYDPEILYRLFAMLTPGSLQKNCCKDFIDEALHLSESIQKKNVAVFKLARDLTNC